MPFFLTISRCIDRLNEAIGKSVAWLILLAVLVCAINSIVVKVAHIGSNAFLELQWYLYATVFLLASSYTLKKNEHVRIDVITSHLSKRTNAWIDIFGFVFFLLPMTLLMLWYGTPYAWNSILSQELSNNAGGLIVWPAKLLIPASFLLLTLQGMSELIKRLAFLRGLIDSKEYENAGHNPQEEIAAIASANNLNIDTTTPS